MDIQQPATLAESRKAPIVVGSGDYVLATKYRDGDPQDHWCIGFYKEAYLHCGHYQRHIVVDENGQSFRGNGFRRCKKISKERGAWMLEHSKDIEMSGMSVWHFARCSMKWPNEKVSDENPR